MQYKEILTATLKAFSELCDREGLRGFIAFGSAIGAVRHGGIIPWDDDIDVYMPREDFQRLLALEDPAGYEILHLTRSSQPLPYTYAKFCDASSTIWEQRKYPCPGGRANERNSFESRVDMCTKHSGSRNRSNDN